MSYKVISKPYYSNCLFETIREKLRDWKNVKVYKIPYYLNVAKIVHFYWKNTKTNLYYSFISYEKKGKWCHLLFKGNIVEFDEEEYEELINYHLRHLTKALEKKLGFTSDLYRLIERRSELHWNDYYPRLIKDAFLRGNPYNYIEGAYKGKDNKDVIKFYEIGEKGIINPDNDKLLYWRIPIDGLPR